MKIRIFNKSGRLELRNLTSTEYNRIHVFHHLFIRFLKYRLLTSKYVIFNIHILISPDRLINDNHRNIEYAAHLITSLNCKKPRETVITIILLDYT